MYTCTKALCILQMAVIVVHCVSIDLLMFCHVSDVFLLFYCRNDLELQFSCYLHNDKQEVCNWPNGVSVSINEKKLQIDRVSL